MSGDFRRCIDEAEAKGEIDGEAAATARAAYDDAFASASPFGPDEADRQAAGAALSKLEAEAIEVRRRRALGIRARKRALGEVKALKERRGYQGVRDLGQGGGKPPAKDWSQGGRPPEKGPGSKGALAAYALELIVENLPGQSGKAGASMGGRHRALVGQAHAMMAAVIERFESRSGAKLRGHRAAKANLIREAFGEDTGDLAAKGFAEAWRESSEWLRLQFNAAGGAIGKLDGWGLPQAWDPIEVRRVGKEGWVERVLPLLARDRMTDRATGRPFTEARLRATLGEVWTSIVTGGADGRMPGEHLGRGMVAKRRGEERFLIFRDADAWMTAQGQFGHGDVFEVMMGHIDAMAVDVAQMQVLGPNPRHQFEWLSRYALREAALEEAAGVDGAIKKAERHVRQAEMMYDHFTGSATVPLRPGVAKAFGATRNALTGMTLGGAVLSEIPSAPMFGRMARSFSGLSADGDMMELARLIALPSERAIARRSGFIVEQATDGFIRASQDSMRLMSVGERTGGTMNAIARRLPALTLRATMLTPFVQARKRSFRFEFMGRLHDVRDRRIADLAGSQDAGDRALAEWLTARGFDEAEWGVIRATEAWEPRHGAKFLRPADVADPELGLRLAEAIELETRLMTPETSLWTRAKLIGDEQPGTRAGEVARSWAMFRGFTVTASHMYGQEIALRGLSRARGNLVMGGLFIAQMAVPLTIGLTLAGALSIQLREVMAGRDPRPMGDARFWGAALLQGGGLGIVGDLFYAAEARNGKSAPIVAAGPVGQALSDGWNLTGGNVLEVAAGLSAGEDLGEAVEGARVGRDAARAAGTYNPLASWWWTRAAYARLVTDNLQRALDPDADDDFRRRARRLERERGQGQWWPEGSGAPERAPELATALNGPAD